MKTLKILGIVALVLLGGAGAAWAAFLRAPSEADLCKHLGDLMEQQTPGFSASPAAAEFQSSCPKQVAKGKNEGAIPYAKRAKCVLAATSMDAVEACR